MNTITSITLALIAVTAIALINIDSDDHFAFAGNGTKNCDRDCEPPTLGVSQINFQRVVSNGFCYNGSCVDAQSYYTPYPLITTKIGQQNTAKVTIYDNEGTSAIRHVAIGFGIKEGTFFGDSETQIVLDIDHRGIQTISKVDPNNAIGKFDVSATTKKDSIYAGNNVLEVTFTHTFVKPLDFNIVSVFVWDYERNGWQYYFNDGVQVIDPSKPIVQEPVKAQPLDPNVQHFLLQKQNTDSYLEKYPQYKRHTNAHDRDSLTFNDRLVEEQVKAEQTLERMFVSVS